VLHCTHMNTDTFSVRLNQEAKARLQKLAKSTGRSRSFLGSRSHRGLPRHQRVADRRHHQSARFARPRQRRRHERVRDWVRLLGDAQRASRPEEGMTLIWSPESIHDLIALARPYRRARPRRCKTGRLAHSLLCRKIAGGSPQAWRTRPRSRHPRVGNTQNPLHYPVSRARLADRNCPRLPQAPAAGPIASSRSTPPAPTQPPPRTSQ